MSVTGLDVFDRTIHKTNNWLHELMELLVRGFYYEGWVPAGKPLKERHREQFLARIAQELRGDNPIDPEAIACAVFALLAKRVSEGEIDDVKHVLPADIRHLWP